MSQSKQQPYLTYAINTNNKLVHIDSVPKGKACGCVCPCCKSKLEAKNGGNVRVHHFAHAKGSECTGAIESALHIMAKEILQEHKNIMLPPAQQGESGGQKSFYKVDIELYNKDLSLYPDCVGYTENDLPTWIEFKNTHEVDIKKAEKIISAKIDCVEIDLHTCELDPQKVKSFIENSRESRKWIYNHEVPQSFLPRSYNNFWTRIPRHLAIDEQNKIVDLYNYNSIDKNEHKYYCIACGKEGRIINGTFFHLDKNVLCEDSYYLHEAAKKILRERFYQERRFPIAIFQQYVCKKWEQCRHPDKNKCITDRLTDYDLKKHGYNSCEIKNGYSYECPSYDLVLKQDGNMNTAIIISIDSGKYFTDPKNLSNRTIKITITNEWDILRLMDKEPFQGDNVSFLNFKYKVKTNSC